MTKTTVDDKTPPEPKPTALEPPTSVEDERRGEGREPFGGQVVIRFDNVPLVGSGENISHEGVYFVAKGAVRVLVQMEGQEPLVGQVVRMTSMGNGQTGIAVVFDEQ